MVGSSKGRTQDCRAARQPHLREGLRRGERRGSNRGLRAHAHSSMVPTLLRASAAEGTSGLGRPARRGVTQLEKGGGSDTGHHRAGVTLLSEMSKTHKASTV